MSKKKAKKPKASYKQVAAPENTSDSPPPLGDDAETGQLENCEQREKEAWRKPGADLRVLRALYPQLFAGKKRKEVLWNERNEHYFLSYYIETPNSTTDLTELFYPILDEDNHIIGFLIDPERDFSKSYLIFDELSLSYYCGKKQHKKQK